MLAKSIDFGCNQLHEQYPPDVLLKFAVMAEQSGFDSVWCSDVFHPWFHTDANSGFAWVWLAAAAERTKKVRIGTAVTAPILRYNPAIVAQAFATLAAMYPNRINLGLGTGEPLSECPLGGRWPPFKERVMRLEEAIIVMKKLWTENFVTFKGKYYALSKANLYTRPPIGHVKLFVATSGKSTAELAGRLADGIIVPNISPVTIQECIFPAARKGLRLVKKDERLFRKICHIVMSYDENYDQALKSCRIWGGITLPFMHRLNIGDPREVEMYARKISDDELSKNIFIATDPDECIKKFEEYVRIGIQGFNLSSISPNQEKFIRVIGKEVISHFKIRKPNLHKKFPTISRLTN